MHEEFVVKKALGIVDITYYRRRVSENNIGGNNGTYTFREIFIAV